MIRLSALGPWAQD